MNRTTSKIAKELKQAQRDLAEAIAEKDDGMAKVLRIVAAQLLNEWAESMAKDITKFKE